MFKETEKYLSLHGVRPSLQRMAVMNYLIKNKTHPTVDEIYNALAPDMPTLSRMTVYNTLSLLTKQGAIRMLDMDHGVMHYDDDLFPHAHFICTACGAIIDVPPNKKMLELFAAGDVPGATVEEVQLTYKGVCAQCSKKTNS